MSVDNHEHLLQSFFFWEFPVPQVPTLRLPFAPYLLLLLHSLLSFLHWLMGEG